MQSTSQSRGAPLLAILAVLSIGPSHANPCMPPLNACEEMPCNVQSVDTKYGWYCARRQKWCNETLLTVSADNRPLHPKAQASCVVLVLFF